VLFDKTARHIQKLRPVLFLEDTIQWVETARCLGVNLHTQLTSAEHNNQVGKKTAEGLGVLVPLVNKRSGLSIRNGVLLYKQLTSPLIDYECPIWRSAVCSHVRKLLVLQSKCLRIATKAPWYVRNRKIHEDLGFTLLADYIRAVTEFLLKLADAGNPLVRQLGRHLR
jgi:hypothetical protein